MRNYYRWAALAGAAVLAVSNATAVQADEINQSGVSQESAFQVPPLPAGQENGMSGETVTVVGQVETLPQEAAAVVEQVETLLQETVAAVGQVETLPQETAAVNQPGEVLSDSSAAPGQAGTMPQETAPAQTGNVPQETAASADTGTNSSGTENTSSTRVIRAGEGGSSNSVSTSPTGSSDSSESGAGVDYSLGPGAFNQSSQPSQPSQSSQPAEPTVDSEPAQLNLATQTGDILIYDVMNPVVRTVEKYSYDQMVQDITLLQQKYSSHMQVNPIGTSLDGRVMYDCIVGNAAAPKHILIQGGIHAREYLNPMLMMQQMEMALANYDIGSYKGVPLSVMFSQVAVHFVPMTNPDGITISQFGVEGIRSPELKDTIGTCYVMDVAAGRASDLATYLSRWKANARGVDLNLNFDALWAGISTTFPSYSGYKGTAPGSEPEAQALIQLYQSQYPWKAVINYHSMGNVIYWDIAGNKVQPQSAELANLMSAVTGGYRILPSNGGGGYKDWIQLSDNPVPSVTLETGKVTCPMPLSEYAGIWAANRLTWAYTMEWVAGQP